MYNAIALQVGGLLAQSGIAPIDNIITSLTTIGQGVAAGLAVLAFVFACIRGAAGVAAGGGGAIGQAISSGLAAVVLAGLAIGADDIVGQFLG